MLFDFKIKQTFIWIVYFFVMTYFQYLFKMLQMFPPLVHRVSPSWKGGRRPFHRKCLLSLFTNIFQSIHLYYLFQVKPPSMLGLETFLNRDAHPLQPHTLTFLLLWGFFLVVLFFFLYYLEINIICIWDRS